MPLLPASWPVPLPAVVLSGRLVRLEPIEQDHLADLVAAGRHEAVWTYSSSDLGTPEAMRVYVEYLLRQFEAGTALPYAVRRLATGRIVGATVLLELSRTQRSGSVGSWYSPEVWRTGVNTEAKRLLLGHAFQTLECLRIEFRTDALNTSSRAALTRLGAVQEGLLRCAKVTADGRRLDTVIYSLLDTDWPVVRRALDARLEGTTPPDLDHRAL